jgi:hypothetical protein
MPVACLVSLSLLFYIFGDSPVGTFWQDLEAQVRRLSREVRAIRERLGDGNSRMADSDHAMLSGKPLMGYRCLACDRPLEKLDERSGPYLPSQQVRYHQK